MDSDTKETTVKDMEDNLLEIISKLENNDKRWAAIARTHFEEGFMALRRSINN